MHIRCPHCHNPFESVEGSSWASLLCPTCGSSFSLSGTDLTHSYRPGAFVLGHFELVEEVGSGRYGSVWKARDTQLERTVAVKIPRERNLDAYETEVFLRDARAAAQLKHPRIAGVHEIGREADTVYIVSDFIDGANLSEWMSCRPLTARQSAELMVKIAEALDHAHESGVIHRDLKPTNIMLDRKGEPHVIDFGLARRESGDVTVTVEGQVLGTPSYMSPEQARGEGHAADRRSDVYSAGVILYQLLTGELPFRGELRMLIVQILTEDPPSPRKLRADVPRDLETITLKCLEKDRAKRYQTALDLASDLRRFLAEEPIQARPVRRIERAWRWCKRNPAIASLAAALLGVLTTVSIVAPFVAVRQARLGIALENQSAASQLVGAWEAHNAGSEPEGIAHLCHAYEGFEAVGSGDPLRSSIRTLMPAWSRDGGIPIMHNRPVIAAAFSPDGATVLTGGHDPQCTARLWDAHTLRPVGEPLQHQSGSVRAVAFSPNGQMALTGSEDKTARLWNAKTGRPLGATLQHDGQVWAVAFSHDGNTVATGSTDKMARLWDVRTGKQLGNPIKPGDVVISIAFSADDQMILTGTRSSKAQLWDVRTGAASGKAIDIGGKIPIHAVAFSPDGTKIVTASGDKMARLWDARTLEPIGVPFQHSDEVYAAVFSPDGRKLLTGSFDNTAQLWDVETQKPIGKPLQQEGAVMGVAFSSDGRRALTASTDRTARVWDIVESKSLSRDAPVLAVAFSHDGRTLLTGCADEQVRFCGIETGDQNQEPLPMGDSVKQFQFSADGKTGVVQYANQSMRLWSFAKRAPLAAPVHLQDDQVVRAFSPDCKTVLVGNSTPTGGQLWDAQAGLPGLELLPDDRIMGAAFSPDGRTVVLACYKQAVRIFDVESGKEVPTQLDHNGIVYSVAVSQDGKTLISGSKDRTARLWDFRTGAALGQPLRHPGNVTKVAVSPDSRLALTICIDGSAYLWDVQSCRPLTQPLQHEVKVVDGVFNANGSTILFNCADGGARVYDVPQSLPDDRKLIRAWARARSGYEITDQGLPQQLTQSQWLESQKELSEIEQRNQETAPGQH